jgi:hypothetical protein
MTRRRHQAAHGDERVEKKSESGKGASDVSEHVGHFSLAIMSVE